MAIPGDLIKQARENRNKKQAQIAQLLNRTQGYISKIESEDPSTSEKGGIKGDELLKVARYLDYDPYVFTGELSFEEGDLRNREKDKTITDLSKKVEYLADVVQKKVPDIIDLETHKIVEVLNRDSIRECISKIQNWNEDRIQMILGFIQGMEGQELYEKYAKKNLSKKASAS